MESELIDPSWIYKVLISREFSYRPTCWELRNFHCWMFQDGARSIHTAARYGHVGIINTLLQKGEKVDVTTNVSVKGLYSLVNC